MIYATSDIHGYPLDSFLRLLDRAGFGDSDRLYVLGDVIDRNGDGGVAMLRWIMTRPNVRLLMGNHEDMLLSCSFLFSGRAGGMTDEEARFLDRWLRNGAKKTIASLRDLAVKNPAALRELLRFMKGLPLYQTVTAGGRKFLLVHSGLGNFSPERKLQDYTRFELLWTRPARDERYFPDVMTVLGHTPTGYLFGKKGKMFRTETWADIDIGAAGGGPPMLLRLDDMREFYV